MLDKKEMIGEMMAFLPNYEFEEWKHYAPTEYGCECIYNEQIAQKGSLMSVLEKHPNYNGRNMIVLDENYHRQRDNKIVGEFCDYLGRRTKGEHRYVYQFHRGEIVRVAKSKNGRHPYAWVDSMNQYLGKEVATMTDDGGPTVECKSGDGCWWWYDVTMLEHLDGTPYATVIDGADAFSREDYRFVRRLIEDSGQYLDNETVEKVNGQYPWIRLHNGAKLSRVVKKICQHFSIADDPDFNGQYTRFADAINPLVVKTWTIISWHIIDYWAMSFGRGWASCHSIDKTNRRGMPNSYDGMYCSGTESYMLDPASVVVYIVDKEYNGDRFELQPKIQRQMFHISEDGTRIVQGRLYPQDNDCGSKERYDEIRAVVQRVVFECFGHEANGWDVKRGTCECENVIESTGTHYRDYECFDNCNVSTLRGSESNPTIYVGHYPICPTCGEEHEEEANIVCDDCRHIRVCPNCGQVVDRHEGIRTYDGEWFCCEDCVREAGYVYCNNDDEWHMLDGRHVIHDHYLDDYVYCGWRDPVIVDDEHKYLTYDHANRDGWYKCRRCGRWVREEDYDREHLLCSECSTKRVEPRNDADKIEIGSKIRILDGSHVDQYRCHWVSDMNRWAGEVCTVDFISDDHEYVRVAENGWSFDIRYVELVD